VVAAAERSAASLGPRIATGVVLALGAVAAVWAGGHVFLAVASALTGVVIHEWVRMNCSGRRRGTLFLSFAVVAGGAPLFALWGAPCALAAGAVVVALAAIAARFEGNGSILLAGGLLLFLLAFVALNWLRGEPGGTGLATVYWLFVVVWATDTGAFAFGRLIGGAKIAPRLSPNKTWAGALGGLVTGILCAIALGFIYSATGLLAETPSLALIVPASAILSILAQVGDFVESGAKRHFGVKDSGALLPGHGGALDRLDSLLFVAPFIALAVWLAGGSERLLWQGG
jgi:phosphatidate cytidylyltransferase